MTDVLDAMRYDLQLEFLHTDPTWSHCTLGPHWLASERESSREIFNSYQYWISIDLNGVQLDSGRQLLFQE